MMAVALLWLLPAPVAAEGVPKMSVVTPGLARPGDVVKVDGEYLDKGHVAEVYITDGTNDFKVQITKQTGTMIEFRVPPDQKAGKFSLMVLTAGEDPKLIEEPVRLVIEGGRQPS
jgi:hypothetical protein